MAVKIAQAHQKAQNGGHLRGGFELAYGGHGHAAALTGLRHPFAQRRNGDFAADDDHGENGISAPQAHQQNQRHGHHQFIGHGVEKSAEIGGLLPAAGEKAVKPVGDGGDGENGGRQPVDGVVVEHAFGQEEKGGEHGDEQHAHPGEENGEIPRHNRQGFLCSVGFQTACVMHLGAGRLKRLAYYNEFTGALWRSLGMIVFRPSEHGIQTACICPLSMQAFINLFGQGRADAFHLRQVFYAGGGYAAQAAEADEQGLAAFVADAGNVA